MATWALGLSLAVIALVAFAPGQLHAGTMTYTWSGQGSGELTVDSVVAQNGQIQFSDVVGFQFNVFPYGADPPYPWAPLEYEFGTDFIPQYPTFPIPVSSTGVPTGDTFLYAIYTDIEGYFAIGITFNPASFNGMGQWYEEWGYPTGSGTAIGYGGWSISVAGVPEPPSVVMAGLAALSGVAYRVARKGRGTRPDTMAA